MITGVHTYHGRHRARRRGPAGFIAGGAALALAAAAAMLATSAEQASASPNGKVTLCHATSPASAKNGWVQITVSTNAVTHAGHGSHADDIIPAFTYTVKGRQSSYPGKNLDTDFGGMTGQQLLDNGCVQVAPASSSAASSTAAAGGASTGTAPSIGATGSDNAGPGTSSTASGGVEGVGVTASGAAGGRGAGSNSGVYGGGVDAARATAPANGAAVAPAAAGASGLAVGDTGDHGTGGGAAAAAAVVGGSLAVLVGMGVLAMRRRRPDAGA